MSYSERSVKDKNFVFFGGSQGMGRAAAMALAERGAAVLIVGRNRDAAEAAVADALQAGAGKADVLNGDLSTVAGIKAVAEGVKAWRGNIHGVMHTAMSAFNHHIVTEDKLEFAFALQYLARASLNRLLAENLAASGDGRIVHIAGNVSEKMAGVDLDDLQFENRKWSFFKAILGTHYLGFLHLQEAAKRWQEQPISLTACCVASVKTKVMLDKNMPLIMRLMGRFGTTAEKAAQNAIRVLTADNPQELNDGVICRNSKQYQPEQLALSSDDASKLWSITTDIAAERGLVLP